MSSQLTSDTDDSPFSLIDTTPTSSTSPEYRHNPSTIPNILPPNSLTFYNTHTPNIVSDAALMTQHYPCVRISKEQSFLLLNTELKSRNEANKLIKHRLIDDEKQFENIENALNLKIKKYQQNIKHKLQKIEAINMERMDFDYIDDLLDEIIEIDEKSNNIRKQLRKKKWYESKNEIYRIVSSNHKLMNEIDGITQNIDYWQQMILNTAQTQYQQPMETNSFVVKEVLRIKSENEALLSGLRLNLDEIRSKRT